MERELVKFALKFPSLKSLKRPAVAGLFSAGTMAGLELGRRAAPSIMSAAKPIASNMAENTGNAIKNVSGDIAANVPTNKAAPVAPEAAAEAAKTVEKNIPNLHPPEEPRAHTRTGDAIDWAGNLPPWAKALGLAGGAAGVGYLADRMYGKEEDETGETSGVPYIGPLAGLATAAGGLHYMTGGNYGKLVDPSWWTGGKAAGVTPLILVPRTKLAYGADVDDGGMSNNGWSGEAGRKSNDTLTWLKDSEGIRAMMKRKMAPKKAEALILVPRMEKEAIPAFLQKWNPMNMLKKPAVPGMAPKPVPPTSPNIAISPRSVVPGTELPRGAASAPIEQAMKRHARMAAGGAPLTAPNIHLPEGSVPRSAVGATPTMPEVQVPASGGMTARKALTTLGGGLTAGTSAAMATGIGQGQQPAAQGATPAQATPGAGGTPLMNERGDFNLPGPGSLPPGTDPIAEKMGPGAPGAPEPVTGGDYGTPEPPAGPVGPGPVAQEAKMGPGPVAQEAKMGPGTRMQETNNPLGALIGQYVGKAQGNLASNPASTINNALGRLSPGGAPGGAPQVNPQAAAAAKVKEQTPQGQALGLKNLAKEAPPGVEPWGWAKEMWDKIPDGARWPLILGLGMGAISLLSGATGHGGPFGGGMGTALGLGGLLAGVYGAYRAGMLDNILHDDWKYQTQVNKGIKQSLGNLGQQAGNFIGPTVRDVARNGGMGILKNMQWHNMQRQQMGPGPMAQEAKMGPGPRAQEGLSRQEQVDRLMQQRPELSSDQATDLVMQQGGQGGAAGAAPFQAAR